MSTVTYGSTYLGYALNKSSEWNSGYAAQGAAKAGQPRDGLMLYGGLRSSVNWADQSVTEVRLYLDFGTAGASRRKTIGLYASSRNSAGGVGSAVRGTYFGTFMTSSTTYGAKETVTFNATTNAGVFAGLKNWIENGTTVGLVMFMNESDSSSYSTNFLNVDGTNIQIDYELKGSKGSITPDPADIGSDVTLHIDAVTASQTVTHTAEFELGSASSGVIQLAEGVTDYTYTLPMAWLGQLASGASSGTATCTLSTYIGGSLTGTRVISFTARVPSAYAPVISDFTVERYSSYVDDQGHTQYKPDLMGGYVWVTLTAQMDTSSGLTPALTLQYWPNDDDTDVTTVPITWAGTGTPSTMTLTNDRSIVTAAVPIANAYVFELVFSNGHQTTIARSNVQKSWAAFHVAGSGYGVGIGKFSGGTQAEPSFDVAWPTTFDGDVTVNGNLIAHGSGDTGWISLGRASGVNAQQGPGFTGIAYRVVNGNHVYVAAYVSLSSNWTSNKQINSDAIPAQYRPTATVYRFGVTGGRYIIRTYVGTGGDIHIEWVQNIASSSQTSSASVGWTDIWIEYFIS